MKVVRLHDGREVDTASEEWRHTCEAKSLLALPTLFERRRAIERIEQARGKPEADRLRATMTKLWQMR